MPDAADLAFLADAQTGAPGDPPPAPPRPTAPACLTCGWLLDGPHGPVVVVHVEAPGGDYDLCGRCAGS